MIDLKIVRLPGELFNGLKLQIARENAKFSRTELAIKTETSASFITSCEKGRKKPSRELESLLAHVLNVQPKFFHGPLTDNWAPEACHFRHRQIATDRLKGEFRSEAFMFSELIRVLKKVVRFPKCTLPTMELNTETPIEAIAAELRHQWGINPDTPIARICRLVENAGVVIGFHSFVSDSIDACSKRAETPFILVTKTGRGNSRLHSDIAHELAEIIFSKSASSEAIYERLINRFVGTLFMPKTSFAPHFLSKPLTLSHLWSLKRTWYVSASAILQRALGLELLQYETFVLWKRKLVARGFGKREPEEPQFSDPESARRALLVAGQQGISSNDIAEEIGIKVEVLDALIAPYLTHQLGSEVMPHLV